MHSLIPVMATLLVAAASAGQAWAATQCARQSPAHRVALIELYTSEGCDSCPAADKWLSGLSGPQSGEKAVTLALHVDYWDRLGWKDRFANPLFTERQGKLSGLGGSKVVYKRRAERPGQQAQGIYRGLAHAPWFQAQLGLLPQKKCIPCKGEPHRRATRRIDRIARPDFA